MAKDPLVALVALLLPYWLPNWRWFVVNVQLVDVRAVHVVKELETSAVSVYVHILTCDSSRVIRLLLCGFDVNVIAVGRVGCVIERGPSENGLSGALVHSPCELAIWVVLPLTNAVALEIAVERRGRIDFGRCLDGHWNSYCLTTHVVAK